MLLSIFILKIFSITALTHPLFALPTILLIYVNDILPIFYFVQTGRGVKDGAEEAGIDIPELTEIRRNHGVASKGATMNIIYITIAAVFGGTTVYASWGSTVHGMVALIAVVLYLKGTFDSFKYLWRNSEYMNTIAASYQEAMDAPSNGSGTEQFDD